MHRSSSYRFASGVLVLLLGALATGLPSHAHVVAGDEEDVLAPVDHHGHGVVVAEQGDRIPSVHVGVSLSTASTRLATAPTEVAPEMRSSPRPLFQERDPPAHSPRAPPPSF